MLVGESPGTEEYRRNQVFCGPTGIMFRAFVKRTVENKTGWGRGFWYTNAVKAYCGEHGNPSLHIAEWRDDLFEEIRDIQPDRVLVFGRVAIESVFMESLSVGEHVGGWKWVDFGNGVIIPAQICMHPTATLHNKAVASYWRYETSRAILVPPDIRLRSPDDIEVVEIEDPIEAENLLDDELPKYKYIGYDVETGDDSIYLAAFAVSVNKVYVFHDDVINDYRVKAALESLFANPSITFVAHNWKFDAHMSVEYLGVNPAVFTDINRPWMDTLSMSRINDCERLARLEIAEWQVGMGGRKKSQMDLIGKHTKPRFYEAAYVRYPKEMAIYNGHDAVSTLRLYFHYRKRFAEDPRCRQLWSDIVKPLGPVFFDMETVGIQLDTERLELLGNRLDGLIEIEKLRIRNDPIVQRLEQSGSIKPPFNPNSADHKRELLFGENGIGLKSDKLTSGGKQSVDKYVLKDMSKLDTPILKSLEMYSRLVTLKRNYQAKWSNVADRGGVIHTNYHQTGARTMRTSSTDPPMQTVPRKSLPGDEITSSVRKDIRCAIIPHSCDEEVAFCEVDYSQMELRILAQESDDAELTRCFNEGIDVHSRTAAIITGKSLDEITKDDRQMAKPVNFGVSYGQSAQGLVGYARDNYGVTMSESEAKEYLRSFFRTYNGVLRYQNRLVERAERQGYVMVNWCGIPLHRRNVHEIGNPHFRGSGIRKTKNSPIQGGASFYTLYLLIILYHLKRAGMIPGLRYIVGTVHDSVWFEAYKKHLKECVETVCRVAVSLPCTVPIEVEAKVGKSLGEMADYMVVSSKTLKPGERFDFDTWTKTGELGWA